MSAETTGRAGRSIGGVIVLSVMGLIFAAVGVGGLGKLTGNCLKVRSWVETPATLHSCTLSCHGSHGRHRGTVYCPQVAYTYSYAGRKYTGDTFDNLGGASSFFNAEQAKVARHPVGETVVWVNPENPAEAVLERAKHPPLILCALFAVFAAVGSSMLVVVVRAGCSRLRPEPERSFFMQPLPASMPLEIKQLAGFTILWNAISWIVASGVLSDTRIRDLRGFDTWFPVILASIFPLLGCGMVVKLLSQLVGYWTGSRHAVTVTCSALRPGVSMQVVYGMDDEPAFEKLEVAIIAQSSELSGSKGRVPPPSCECKVLSLKSPGPLKSGSFDFVIPELHAEPNVRWRLQFRYCSGAKGRSRPVDYRLE